MQRAKLWQQFFSNTPLLFGSESGWGPFIDWLEIEETFPPVQTHKDAQPSAAVV